MKSEMRGATTFALIALLSIFSVSGCAYRKEVKPNLPESLAQQKLPHRILVDGSRLAGGATTAYIGALSITVDHGDALLESIKHELGKVFERVSDKNESAKIENYDFVLSASNNVINACKENFCQTTSITFFSLKDRNSQIVAADNITEQFTWGSPAEASVLGAVSAATLMITAPVLAPIATDMVGDTFRTEISKSNDRTASRVAEIVQTSKPFRKIGEE